MHTIKSTGTKRWRIIAFLLRVNEQNRGLIVGYRFLDEDSLQVYNCTEEETFEALTKGPSRRVVLSHGAMLNNRGHLALFFGRQLIPTSLLCFNLADGDIKHIPVVDADTGECLFNDSFIFRARIIDRLHEVGFLVTNYIGECLFMSAEELLRFSQATFYNGKRIVRGKDITFVELKGRMPEIQLASLKQQNSQKVSGFWGRY